MWSSLMELCGPVEITAERAREGNSQPEGKRKVLRLFGDGGLEHGSKRTAQ